MPRPQKKSDVEILQAVEAEQTETIIGESVRALAERLGLSFEATRRRLQNLSKNNKVMFTKHGVILSPLGSDYLDFIAKISGVR